MALLHKGSKCNKWNYTDQSHWGHRKSSDVIAGIILRLFAQNKPSAIIHSKTLMDIDCDSKIFSACSFNHEHHLISVSSLSLSWSA